MENGFFFKTVPPPRDTGIPLKHDYVFIKEVETPNGISYHSGGGGGGKMSYMTFGTWEGGGVKVTRYLKMLYF